MIGIHQIGYQSDINPDNYIVLEQDHARSWFDLPISNSVSQRKKMFVFQAMPTSMSTQFIVPSHVGLNLDDELDHAIIIPVRDLAYNEAKREIEAYVDKLQSDGDTELSIGEIARHLRLDLDIVIDVFEEHGILD